jgi:hypothetical protein
MGALAVGCTSDPKDSGPSDAATSPTTTPTPTLSKEDQAVADAEAAYKEYFTLKQEVMQNPGMDGFDSVIINHTTGDVGDQARNYQQIVNQGADWHQVGQARLVSIVPAGYEDRSDAEIWWARTVTLDVCIDWTGVEDTTGTYLPPIMGEIASFRPPLPNRLPVTYAMVEQPALDSGGQPDPTRPTIWQVSSATIQEGEAC